MNNRYPFYLTLDDPHYSYYNLVASTFKVRVEIDYETNRIPVFVKSLRDLCCEKLVMDVYYLRYSVHLLPNCLYFLILRKALCLGRTLTIKNFLKHCPEKVFIFPTPSELSNWTVIEMLNQELRQKMRTMIENTVRVIGTFLDIICKNQKSCLQILDMNEAFIPVPLLQTCLKVLSNLQNLPKESYLLKIGILVMKKEDTDYVIYLKTLSPISSFFKIRLIGLSILEAMPKGARLSSLLELLEIDELVHFSYELYQNLDPIIPILRKFHLLQSLVLTYVDGFMTDPKFFLTFAETLYHLRLLKKLKLTGSCLSNCLQTLFTHNCVHAQNFIHCNENCCILHHGCIEYLDLESCRLKDPDAICLQGFSASKTLKVLNISYNIFNAEPLSELIEKLGNSLVILNLKCCVLRTGFPYLFPKFKFLLYLKSINLEKFELETEDVKLLSNYTVKMPSLQTIHFSLPNPHNFEELGKEVAIRENILKSQKQINVCWTKTY